MTSKWFRKVKKEKKKTNASCLKHEVQVDIHEMMDFGNEVREENVFMNDLKTCTNI